MVDILRLDFAVKVGVTLFGRSAGDVFGGDDSAGFPAGEIHRNIVQRAVAIMRRLSRPEIVRMISRSPRRMLSPKMLTTTVANAPTDFGKLAGSRGVVAVGHLVVVATVHFA